MYITEIELTNLRSFGGKNSISLAHRDGGYAGWTVFAGRNGAGKSTLLKALALSVVGPVASKSIGDGFRDWVRTDAGEATVATLLQRDRQVDAFQSGGRKAAAPFWTGLKWTRSTVGPDSVTRWLEKEPAGRQKRADRGPWAEVPTGWFLVGYGPYRHLGTPPAELVKLSSNPVIARLINLFHETATLSDAVDWLKQIHFRALENRPGAEELKAAVLEVLSDGLLPDGSSVLRVDSEALWVRRDGITMPLEQVSDGYRTVAALVVDLLRGLHSTFGALNIERSAGGHTQCNLPGVVLIDEVDAHMHVAWQQHLGFWLTSRFPRLQFLVTTHSPFICQAASPGGLIRLPGPGETRRLEHVRDETWRAISQGGADDAVLTELFGLEHAHSAQAEQQRRALAVLEARILRGQATPSELVRYQSLKEGLPSDLGALADQKLRMVLRGGG